MADKLIKFIADRQVLEEFWPAPIGKNMPDWWKDMPSYGGYNGAEPEEKKLDASATYNSTIKRCVPVLDSLSLGYVLRTDKDIFVKISPKADFDNPDEPTKLEFSWRHWDGDTKAVEGHQFGQAKHHPMAKLFPGRDVFKMINPWHIITPPGYSTLFIPPMNNPNGYFEVLPGVVDTDTYTNCVNFPFVMDAKEIETIIPAGTPICQVFPFKRESWKLVTETTPEDADKVSRAQRKFFTYISSSYRRVFWSRKEFK